MKIICGFGRTHTYVGMGRLFVKYRIIKENS
jgi:hypothetical protein